MFNARAKIFLATSFLSIIGDTLLVFAVPIGLGAELNDIRPAILMWLVPAVAMFCSSFLSKKIANRASSSRSDYGCLLLFLASIEIIVSLFLYQFSDHDSTVLLITVFVFLYAFTKEGIPRLLYTVTVYKYFVSDAEYAKLNGVNNGLNIVGALLGTLFAAQLIADYNWRVALILDAVAFLTLATAILYFGKNVVDKIENCETSLERDQVVEESNFLSLRFVVPLLFAFNALLWNYLPLIMQKRGITGPSAAIV